MLLFFIFPIETSISIPTLEKTEGTTKKWQSRDTGHTVNTGRRQTQHNTTQKTKKMSNTDPTNFFIGIKIKWYFLLDILDGEDPGDGLEFPLWVCCCCFFCLALEFWNQTWVTRLLSPVICAILSRSCPSGLLSNWKFAWSTWTCSSVNVVLTRFVLDFIFTSSERKCIAFYKGVRVMVFNTTFNNTIQLCRGGQFYWWRKPRENHRPATSHWQTFSHNVVSSTSRLSGIRTHSVSGDVHWLHV